MITFDLGWNPEWCSRTCCICSASHWVRPTDAVSWASSEATASAVHVCTLKYQSCHFTFNHKIHDFSTCQVHHWIWTLIQFQSFNESSQHNFKFFAPPEVSPYPWNIQSFDRCFNSLNLCWRWNNKYISCNLRWKLGLSFTTVSKMPTWTKLLIAWNTRCLASSTSLLSFELNVNRWQFGFCSRSWSIQMFGVNTLSPIDLVNFFQCHVASSAPLSSDLWP